MRCANLGIDEPYELAGRFSSVWRKTKRVASRATSDLISAVKDSGIPGFSEAAALARYAGETAEREGWIPKALRTGSAASSAAPEDVADAPAKDNTLLYVGLGAVAILLLARRK